MSECPLSWCLADCLTREEKESLEVHIQSLRQSEAKLKQENSQLKEVAEVARQQNVAMEMWQKSHDSELSSLRHQLLDLQMQSDEKTVIGKLHHQLVMLQVSEASAARNLEEANRKVLYNDKFSRSKIFAVSADFARTAKIIPSKI